MPVLEEDEVQEPSDMMMTCENTENQKREQPKQELKSWGNYFCVCEEVPDMGQRAFSG